MADKFRVTVKLAKDFCTIEESEHGIGADGHTAPVPPVRAERRVNLVKMMKIFGVLLVAGLISLSVYYFIKLNHKDQELEELRNPSYILTSKYSALSEDQATLQSKDERNNSELQESRDMLKAERERKYSELQSKYVTLNEKLDEVTKQFSVLKETLVNVSSERERNYSDLQESRDNLQSQHTTLNEKYVKVTKQYINLQERFVNIIYELKTNYSDLQDSRENLQLECNRNNSELQERLLNVSSEWKRNYSDLQDGRDNLQSQFVTLNEKHDKVTKEYINMQKRLVNIIYELKTNYSDLQESRDNLLSRYATLDEKVDELTKGFSNLQKRLFNVSSEWKINYNDLQDSRDTLQSQYVILNEKHDKVTKEYINMQKRLVNIIYELKTNYSDLQESRDNLLSRYATLDEKLHEVTKQFSVLKEFYCDGTNTSPDNTCSLCKPGWVLFSSKCYFISTDWLTWKESRDWCETRRGRLVNIESSDVQDFLKSKAIGYYWIGGYDISKENKSTKMGAEPVKSKRASDDDKEECLVINMQLTKVFNYSCGEPLRWICESAVFPLRI